ncbi:hypothetical protein EMOOHJMP_00187 [Microcystis phage MaAM05]|nr:hypothetical protein EMOOHJMP_00187 [Microcystis phage MaAM05]
MTSPSSHPFKFDSACATNFGKQAFTLALFVLLSCPPPGWSQGTLPSLDHSPAPSSASLTPAQPLPAPQSAPAPEPFLQPASLQEALPASRPPNTPRGFKTAISKFIPSESAIKPVAYTPLPGIVVFPVIKHGNERAFGDLPLIFAREYAQRLELKVPETRIYHPIYTVDEIRMQGLGHVYDQIMKYYVKAGRPEPLAMDYLLKQLSNNNKAISRVIFVEADLDITHPTQSTSVSDWVKQWATDGLPKQMRYFVRSRMQIFDAESPEFPMVWGGSWVRSIKTDRFWNVTPSTFSDSDSQQAFAGVSRQMSREILLLTPKTAYMHPEYDLAVLGKLLPEARTGRPSQFSENNQNNSTINAENQEAIHRILRRQN